MESEKRDTQILMSILQSASEPVSVDQLDAVLNYPTEYLSKLKVRRILDRGVSYGFVQKCGRKYLLWDSHETDSGKKHPKLSKSAKKKAKKSEQKKLRKGLESELEPKTPKMKPPPREFNSRERRVIEEYEMLNLADTPRKRPLSERTRQALEVERRADAARYRPLDAGNRSIDRRRQPNATVVTMPNHNTFRSTETYRPTRVNLDVDVDVDLDTELDLDAFWESFWKSRNVKK